MDAEIMRSVFEKSKAENKGVTVFLAGHSLAIIVTAIHGIHTVEGRNQQYGRIVIRTDQIVALAGQ